VPQRHESLEIDRGVVSPEYFHTLKTPLVAGREFSDRDDETSQRVAAVNQAFCDRYWPGLDPLGRSVSFYGRTFTIVGVAQNAKYRLLHYAAAPTVFLPLYQSPRDQLIVHLRVAGDPGALAPLLTRTLEGLDPELPVSDVTTLERSMQLGSIFERLAATLVGTFGLLALCLAAVGLYAVVALATRQRTREIGIRMALGAQRRDVFRLVLGQGLRMALVGVAIGLAGALALTRFISSLLYGAQPTDPLTFAGVSAVLIVVVILACYVPARRAAKVDPMKALRYE
jgi:putative ABC transport system permease protein